MTFFGIGEEAEGVGKGVANITGGLRQLITGDTPPEFLAEIIKLESELELKKWEIDSRIPWWESSRSIVLLWLNFHAIIMVYIVLYTNITFDAPAVTALLSLVGVVNMAFFGSKGVEYIKAGKAP